MGETCTDSVLLEEVVIGGEAVGAEALAVVCGRAKAGTSRELNTIIFARILKEAMTANLREERKRETLR